MTKHTPGPWRCVDTSYHAHDYRLLRSDGLPMPVNAMGANDHSEQRANARLIAAAPELLEALKAIANMRPRTMRSGGIDPHDMRNAQLLALNAIRKAEEGA